MQPNIIERVWRQDKMTDVDVLNGFVFTGEAGAHKFVISGKNVNTPVDISGAITANFKNANGVLVPLTGTIEDGKATVVLSQECYAVEGPFSLMIFADTVCIYAAIANAINSSGEVIAYPTATIPSVQELIEEVQDVIASIPQDYSALNQSVTDLKSAFYAESEHFEDYGTGLLSRGDFRTNLFNPSNNTVSTNYAYRVSAYKQMSFPYDITLTIKSGFRIYPWYYSNGEWTAQGFKTGTWTISANQIFTAYIARVTENTSEVANVEEFLKAVVVSGNPIQTSIQETKTDLGRLYTNDSQIVDYIINDYANIEVEQGFWGILNGKLNNVPTDTTRIRSKQIYKIAKGQKVIFRGYNVQCYINVITGIINPVSLQNSGWLANVATRIESVFTSDYDGYIYINFRFGENQPIAPSDYNAYTYVTTKNPYNIPERAVHVYHFGGAGNDWCFVRTPTNYDPKRAKPYPFVICNHGNGWVMDGTIQKANWTKRTMYVPLDDSDYLNDPTEYNGTNDGTLQYSNPTIEALLTAGYVVCGCENYGDALYGNNNCRNACADFFNHMIAHYNVEKRCYMIGASSGALTSLNAAYLLQGAVKAMVLQYPLTCLVAQYEDHSDHRAGIRAAYGITDADITEAELTKAVATHDPLTVDVVDGKKVSVFPPTKLYYSPSDAVVNYQVNALALASMLDNSNKVVATVECSGEHGDHSHFAPADYVAWFDAH